MLTVIDNLEINLICFYTSTVMKTKQKIEYISRYIFIWAAEKYIPYYNMTSCVSISLLGFSKLVVLAIMDTLKL